MTDRKGVMTDRASKLGKTRCPQAQGSSRYRQKMYQKIKATLVRHGRRPTRILTMEDIEEIRQQLMMNILGRSPTHAALFPSLDTKMYLFVLH